MSRIKKYIYIFLSFVPSNGEDIMFYGGYKSQITKKTIIKIPGLPQLKKVGYVEGLKTNIISINQLCDDVAEEVCFLKKGCRIVDKGLKNILVVPRSNDNCYTIVDPKDGE